MLWTRMAIGCAAAVLIWPALAVADEEPATGTDTVPADRAPAASRADHDQPSERVPAERVPAENAPADQAPANDDAAETASATGSGQLSPEMLRQWVAELDHDAYRIRERASAQLAAAAGQAIGPLVEAIEGGSLETIVRGVSLLRRIALDGDRQASKAARTALEQLAAPEVGTAASHAEAALVELALRDEERAYKLFERLGGRFGSGPGTSLLDGTPSPSHAVIGKGWEGDSEDLDLLLDMSVLERLSVFGPRVDDRAVQFLTQLTNLKRLELYGTKISDQGIAAIRNALRSTDIEVRRGGLLGVGGTLTSTNCLITTVRPGSAAADAGVQPGDIVVECEGQKVENFQGLTEVIATKDGGDTIELIVERSGIRIPLKAKLGEWE